MVMLLTVDGVEEVDYTPSDAEIRDALVDSGLYGIVLDDVTWIKSSSGVGWWTIVHGRRVTATVADLGWCWVVDGCGARECWSPELSRIPDEVRAMCCVENGD